MCKSTEDYVKELIYEMELEQINNLFANGCSWEIVVRTYKDIPVDIIKSIYEKVMSTKTLNSET